MGRSDSNQIKYNDKISALRLAIASEKMGFINAVQSDIERLLERRSPVDIGDLKKSWKVTVTGKSKLAGHSISKLSEARPITLGISIESTSRHAIMQMFGWKAAAGQLLTGYKKNGKWVIQQASRPIFQLTGRGRKKKRKQSKIKTFVTRGGIHKPNEDLAFEGGSHSIKAEISRIVNKRLKECKYLKGVTFTSSDIAMISTRNKAVSRIRKWMEGTLDVELNSRAVKGIKRG